MNALALTDHGNLFGAIEFYKACQKAEIKAIIGCEVNEAPCSRLDKKRVVGQRNSYSLVLLAKDSIGYSNLCKLSSIGFLEGFYYRPRIDRDVLKQYSQGLICLSGDLTSRIAQAALTENKDALIEEIRWYQDLFNEDFYLELQRHSMTEEDLQNDGMFQESWLFQKYQDNITQQERVNALLLEVAQELDIKCVATNDTHYLLRSDWKAHEILLNIQSGEPCEIWEKDPLGNPKFRVPNPKRHTYPSHELYFKSPQQMQKIFEDQPEALTTSLEIADKCQLEIDLETRHYPVYIPPSLEGKTFSKEQQQEATKEYLCQLCEKNIPQRYTEDKFRRIKEKYPDRDPLDIVKERLKMEMDVIISKEMCDYLLIVWDFIHWAKSRGIPVGPGRGSGVGSIVLYLIGVTDIEPLRFNLFFERFINPERFSYPDIDVDICMERRNEVINYTMQKYGKDNVAQIITFGTMKARMTIKDVGRVLSVPLAKVNAIAKLVPEELNITLERALDTDVDLLKMYQEDEDARRIIDIGRTLEGSIRNTGIHAAGIIIAGEPLTNYIPICTSKDSEIPVTQYSMKPVESVGMLKIDFLGLKTLTSIQRCTDAVNARYGKDIDWTDISLNDARTFSLLNQGETLGVFQIETGGMQDLARQLHLDKFEEIIAVGALYRPGPMDMIPSFVKRKHGDEAIEFDHPAMQHILSETYGIMVYQEQVMQMASELAGYSLGEGDVLRKAMGKKDMAQMVQEREKFLSGAEKNGISQNIASQIFDKMEKFAAYGFNKSHATAYGYLTYVTAYFKANYPKEWMAALMTCDRDDITKIAKFISEVQTMGIPILPPDVNEAGAEFVATEEGIRFAMTAIKGIGVGVVEAIVEERQKAGPFESLYHFVQRIDAKKVGKKAVENLIDAGAFDFSRWSRDAMRQSVDVMFDTVAREKRDAAVGMMSLFSLLEEDESEHQFSREPQVTKSSSRIEVLFREKELLGFFLTGHPLDAYREILQRLSCIDLSHIKDMDEDSIFRAAFIVEDCNIRISAKNQKKFAILAISDGTVRYELPIWSNLYEEKGELIKDNQLLYAVMQIEMRDGEKRLSCSWFDDLTKVDEKMIQDCDEAYDRAKLQKTKFSPMKREKKSAVSCDKDVQQAPKKVIVTVDIENASLSQVLKMKDLFIKHSGSIEVEVAFQQQGVDVATVHVDACQGVVASDDFMRDILEVQSVTACNTLPV